VDSNSQDGDDNCAVQIENRKLSGSRASQARELGRRNRPHARGPSKETRRL